MRLMTMALLLPLVAACSQTPTERQTAFGAPQATAVSPEAERGGRSAVTVIGTPFYALFKAVGCVGTVVLAAPAAAVVELADRPDKAEMRQSLDRGVGHNCGGSWVLRG
jgi:hypothetical protein